MSPTLSELKVEIIHLKEDKILLKTNYSWAVALNANYNGKAQSYYLERNKLNFAKLKKIFPSWEFPAAKEINEETSFQLRAYQQEDVEFLSQQKNIGIFNEMRTGKTPTALAIFKSWKIPNLLIICPGILQVQWQEAVEKWLNQPAYVISYLSLPERKIIYQRFSQQKGWIIIISKDIFKIDSKYFRDLRKKEKELVFGSIVDEVHFLRNYQSQQSKSIYTLKDSKYKMALSGTPIVNHSSDIFGILKFLQPETYTSYWNFVMDFFTIRESEISTKNRVFKIKKIIGFKDEQTKQELQKRINQISVARKQKDVLSWLPLIEYQEKKLLMEKNQQLIYSRLWEKWKDKYQPLEFLAKLKTLTLYPPALTSEEKRNFLSEENRKLVKDCYGSKITYLTNFCQENFKQSILVFSTRTETFLEPLARCLQESINFKQKELQIGLITGKVSPSQKTEFINAFQKGEIKILLCNIQSAGMGLNLSQADIAIFADRSYSPADNEQAEARFLPTQDSENPKPRLIIDLICKGTIDEKILTLLKRKKDITKIITSNLEYLL